MAPCNTRIANHNHFHHCGTNFDLMASKPSSKWLKKNNPCYYGNVEINAEQLKRLPEDDVPEEILATVRHTDSADETEDAAQGYVPMEDDFQTVELADGDVQSGE
ncbi:hypothetical protein OG21DRAFT_1527573 [Imleria badia]|nr:hypothetical protein OG21DRAFT_1527573 [Imleria badia]